MVFNWIHLLFINCPKFFLILLTYLVYCRCIHAQGERRREMLAPGTFCLKVNCNYFALLSLNIYFSKNKDIQSHRVTVQWSTSENLTLMKKILPSLQSLPTFFTCPVTSCLAAFFLVRHWPTFSFLCTLQSWVDPSPSSSHEPLMFARNTGQLFCWLSRGLAFARCLLRGDLVMHFWRGHYTVLWTLLRVSCRGARGFGLFCFWGCLASWGR